MSMLVQDVHVCMLVCVDVQDVHVCNMCLVLAMYSSIPSPSLPPCMSLSP